MNRLPLLLLPTAAQPLDDLDGQRCSVCVPGDLDGDGVPDIVVTTRMQDPNLVYLFSGKDGRILRVLAPPAGETGFGCAFAAAGDVDRDGVPDLLVGTTDERAYLFSGRDGSILRRLQAPAGNGLSVTSVAGGTDVDGDGVPDILVGARARGATRGSAVLFSGATGKEVLRLAERPSPATGRSESDGFGTSLAFVSDLDGDGTPDLLVGAPERRGFPEQVPGRADPRPWSSFQSFGGLDLFSSKDGGLIRSALGDGLQDSLGWNVGGLSDLDGDRVAAYFGVAISQYLRAYSGKTGATLFTVEAAGRRAHLDAFGTSAQGIHDVDGDGIPDLLVSANELCGGFDRGYAWICSGKDGARIRVLFDSWHEGVDACVTSPGREGEAPEFVLSITNCSAKDGILTRRLRIVSGKSLETRLEFEYEAGHVSAAGPR